MATASTNEINAARAFSKQSVLFDELYGNDTIVQYKRERVRSHINSFLAPGSHLLELNAGTGEDAVYFAETGHTVHATDISKGMLDQLSEKVVQKRLQNNITH